MQKSGTYTWFGYIAPFEERLKAIKDAGFDTICSFWTKEMEEADGRRVEQPEKADKYGLYLEHTHLNYYGCNALWNDDLKAEAMVETYLDDIRIAKEAGVKTLVIHPCEVFAPDFGEYEIMRGHMKKLADECGKFGIRLAIENLGETEVIRRIINDLSENEYVGLCFDSGHHNIAEHNSFALLREFKGRVFATHIHDNNSEKDMHVLPYSEECNVDWKKFMENIEASYFEGSLMLEACYPIDYEKMTGENDELLLTPDMPMQEWLRNAKEACDRIYAE